MCISYSSFSKLENTSAPCNLTVEDVKFYSVLLLKPRLFEFVLTVAAVGRQTRVLKFEMSNFFLKCSDVTDVFFSKETMLE